MRLGEVRVSHLTTLCYYSKSSQTSYEFLVCDQFRKHIKFDIMYSVARHRD